MSTTPLPALSVCTTTATTVPPHAPGTRAADHQPAGDPPAPPGGTRGSGTPLAVTLVGTVGSAAHTVATGSYVA